MEVNRARRARGAVDLEPVLLLQEQPVSGAEHRGYAAELIKQVEQRLA